MTVGVGMLGAGPVVQAIHLPTLARLTGLFHVASVMDVSAEVAQTVAGRVGAASCTSLDDLLGDPAVEVVAICSPSHFHADQVIAAMRAGKRAILCEKPFATTREEAQRIAAVSVETGVPVIVGAMHTFDPGWLAATEAWGDLPGTATLVRSRILLPPNARFEDFATEIIERPDFPAPDLADPDMRARMMSGGVLGLAIHNLPLVREFLPDFADLEILGADLLAPFGYTITLQAGGRIVQLIGGISSRWNPEWTFEVIGPDAHLSLTFTPSYVQAGSAAATLTTTAGATVLGPYDHNGYEGEWRRIHDIVEHGAAAPDIDGLIDDLTFAIDIAERAAFAAREGIPA